MNANNSNVTVQSGTQSATGPAQAEGRRRQVWPWVNWGLALSTVPAAAIVMLFALGAVMSTDNCSGHSCPNLGRGGIDFGVAFYGAPSVAFVVTAMPPRRLAVKNEMTMTRKLARWREAASLRALLRPRS